MTADDVRDLRRAAELLQAEANIESPCPMRDELLTLAATLERLAAAEEGTEVTDGWRSW